MSTTEETDKESTEWTSMSNADAGDDSDDAIADMLTILENSDSTILKHGYKKKQIICNTSQGQLILAQRTFKNHKNTKKRHIFSNVHDVAIKTCSKSAYKKKLSKRNADGFMVVVLTDILKESLILHHLTVSNKPTADYLCKWIDFFQDDDNFYLVMEYGGDMNLAQFCQLCHQYVQEDRLTLRDYKKIIKYLCWQITTLMYWLHDDMSCCHLDITLDNILVRAVKTTDCFIYNDDDNTVKVNQNIHIKLCGFGVSEIFPNRSNFLCAKHFFGDGSQYLSPQIFNEEVYDARSSDIWSFGIILYFLSFNKYPYKYQDCDRDINFLAITNNKLFGYIGMNNLAKYVSIKTVTLMSGMLNVESNQRMNIKKLLNHEWFTSYYEKYKQRIDKKSKTQKEKLSSIQQKKRMKLFPFYKL